VPTLSRDAVERLLVSDFARASIFVVLGLGLVVLPNAFAGGKLTTSEREAFQACNDYAARTEGSIPNGLLTAVHVYSSGQWSAYNRKRAELGYTEFIDMDEISEVDRDEIDRTYAAERESRLETYWVVWQIGYAGTAQCEYQTFDRGPWGRPAISGR